MSTWHSFIKADSGYYVDINGESSACFSNDNLYRPILERRIGEGGKAILWIGMNPSTADAYVNDPTVTREMDFSRRWGYSRYIKANVCDYRSTIPKGMLEAPDGPRSAFNTDLILMLAAIETKTIVVCHGVLPKPLQGIATETVQALLDDGHKLLCMGLTQKGMPKHPLYLRADTVPVDYVLEYIRAQA